MTSTSAAGRTTESRSTTAGTTRTTPAKSTGNISRGATGNDVRTVQRALNSQGARLEVDGKFGPLTERAVRDYQTRAGIKIDGIVGPETIGALSRGVNGLRRSPSTTDAAAPGPGGAPGNRTATIDQLTNEGRRNQMATGRITINGNTYDFRSGGYGRGSLPAGTYTVTPHLWSRNDASMNVGGVGYSFALSDRYDPRVGDTRSLLRIHPDGRGPGTEGCVGIVGDAATQRRFREDMRAELERNGGRFTLTLR